MKSYQFHMHRIQHSPWPHIVLVLLAASISLQAANLPDALHLNSKLELFVDSLLIDQLRGNAKQLLHQPIPQEVVLVTDAPWEGNTCAYYTILQDDKIYRMYYRGSHYDVENKRGSHPEFTCYAESRDGIHWVKPNLGIVEFQGSKHNNIVWAGPGTHNFTPFLDANPNCQPEAKYKALARAESTQKSGQQGQALYAFQSPDGIQWALIQKEPVITDGAFDSQNLAFWDPNRKCYADFHRTFRDGVRDIQTCTSPDFLSWTNPVFLLYPGAPREHLYTNAIQLYDRAPHIYLGFPTRFLPDQNDRVEPILMISRDGQSFFRWSDPVIPETAPMDRSGNRSNYMAWGLISLPHSNREYSVYGTEAYYTGPDSRLRRFTYRTDGFVSIHACANGGELLTQPLTFTGRQLVLNYQAKTNGSILVEIVDRQGQPLPNFQASQCLPLSGDEIAQKAAWKNAPDLSTLSKTIVRLRFILKNADLYSLQFTD